MIDYGFKVGDEVCHIKDMNETGFVTELDSDFDFWGGVTTCRLVWGATSFADAMQTLREDQDVQWTNKLLKAQ